MTDFKDLGLIEPLLRAVEAEGYTTATPIQAQAIPALLQGRDVLGLAQTGTGKTAAFALPILQRLFENRRRLSAKTMRALVLTPTRELALQIRDGFTTYGGHLPIRCTVVHGGVGQMPQVHALARGTDVLVATPGRLLDLMAQKHAVLSSVEVFVLDEADRMLDMGFIQDVRTIAAALPKPRQTLLFSATMPDAVAKLAASVLAPDPLRIEVTPQATTVERIDQRVLFVERADKRRLLAELLGDTSIARTIVFARTKHGADRIAEHLKKAGVSADSIHGDKSQTARQKALDGFRAGEVRALVATDIAARGIDVDGVTHVINFDLPNEPESYVHRIGRTARAGSAGMALSFCDAEEVAYLKAIEKTIRQPVPADPSHRYHAAAVAQLHASHKGGGAPKPGARHDRRPPRHGGGQKKSAA
ncbi:DEAD/DEAH box helicase [Azospirillum sp. TSO22-1]|uniref:DEAD/DEAH box helicase n=1 Tax=Azospirillum sp. TSO22-1 TaxID=716789 RepID=UPI000D622DF5|nr:DEAD/DEAH box helicase [Azospirillum sp. TSO22-1]PWC53394.1 DEAD/DEAH box helicase [Azospirillum sp. TSO22-1]